MGFWSGRKTLVTGGAGFIGSHLVEELVERGARVRAVDNLENGRLENLSRLKHEIEFVSGDIRDLEFAKKACEGMDAVLNLAGKVAGVGFNADHHGTMFRDNLLIGFNMLEAARVCGVERVLVVSSACVYPRFCTIPTPESDGFIDDPEPTNFGYGWAKRMAEVQARAYHQEFGLSTSVARPYNTYGPRDHFDDNAGHVIAALIRKIMAGEDPLTVWGSGEQSRSFIYVTDVVEGLLRSVELHPLPDPINIGAAAEIKIKNLVEILLRLTGRWPSVVFDRTKPQGQPRRNCDTAKASRLLGFEAKVNLEEGLRTTIDWYFARLRCPS